FSDQVVKERTDQTLRTMPAEAYARACELLRDIDLRADVSRIASSTLVVCGDHDGPAFVAAAPELAAQIPNARLEWLSGGHAVVLERPEAFTRLVVDFLDDSFNLEKETSDGR